MMPNRSLCFFATLVMVAVTAFGQARNWKQPKTAWGDPDIQGIWTRDDSLNVPLERPHQLGERIFLTEEELAARAKDIDSIVSSSEEGVRPTSGFWARQKGVDAAAV